MRGRDAERELTLKVNMLQVFMSLSNHNSKLAGPSKSALRWTSWHSKITRSVSLKRNPKDTKDNGISSRIMQARTSLCDFDRIFELQSLSKTVFIVNQVRKLQSQYLRVNTWDCILPSAVPGSTRPKNWRILWFFKEVTSFFCHRWFRLQLMAIHCNRRECTQIHFTRRFSVAQGACLMMCITPHWLQCLHARVTSLSIPSMVSGWLFVASLFFALLLSVCLSFTLLFSSHFYLFSVLNLHPCGQRQGKHYLRHRTSRSFCSLGERTPSTGFEPKLFDDFHYSESIDMILQEESGDKDTVPSYLCDAELDDETIGKAVSSLPADWGQASHSNEES